MFNYGDWVIYDSGFKEAIGVAIGRFVCSNGAHAYVCFHTGCTAARVELKKLKPASSAQIDIAPHGIGFHRFDKYCPDYDSEACSYLCASKGGDEND